MNHEYNIGSLATVCMGLGGCLLGLALDAPYLPLGVLVGCGTVDMWAIFRKPRGGK